MRLLMLSSSCLRNALTTSIVLLNTIIHTTLIFTSLGNALDADTVIQADHNHARIPELRSEVYGSPFHQEEQELQSYAPDFVGLDKSIIGRAEEIVTLNNNEPSKNDIDTEDSQFYIFVKKGLQARQLSQQSSALSGLAERGTDGVSLVADGSSNIGQAELESRQSDSATLYVTLNVCNQPAPISSNPNGVPPLLQLYISTTPANKKPTQNNHDVSVRVDGGYGSYTGVASNDVYFGVVAPSISSDFKGKYSYELTASTDQFYASYINDTEMVLVDSDTNSTLLSSNTTNTTIESAPFSVYVHNQQDPAILGLRKSFCGLQNYAQIKGEINGSATADVDTGMMALSPDNPQPQQHFYVKRLNGSAAYYGIKAIAGNSAKSGSGVPGGGGTVYGMVNFTTKSDNNCAVIFNLTFCSEVAYAVPSNPHTQHNVTALTTLYDNHAKDLYQNFWKSLQQIPCNTTSSAQYSLVRNCDDCAKAYKTWLCAVTIPRCEDYSNNALYLQPRAVSQNYPNGSAATNPNDHTFSAPNKTALYMNSSRNSMIDQQIKPGPYKEILPCADICYEVVRSCPASLEFTCPLKHHGLNYTYGFNSPDSLSCNFPGAVAAGKPGVAAALRGNLWMMTTALLAGFIVSL